tara:strand:- start:1572 stop:2225 length:654 start_codon:yes stop_codon:yes gene_type:complete
MILYLKNLAKRLTENQKSEIVSRFTDGETIEFLSEMFNCTQLTIIRNLKRSLGESKYKKLSAKNKLHINSFNETKKDDFGTKTSDNISSDNDFLPVSSFMEITPLIYDIENKPRKDLSSVPLKDTEFPKVAYMIVDKKIELTVKLLKDYPAWSFLPIEDLNRKTIEIYFELKNAKRFCNKEQKVIKVPNTEVFKIAAPFLISRGITRIISDDKLIAI